MTRHPDEPFISDDEIESMRLGNSELLIELQALCDRNLAEARRRKQFRPETLVCCADGWIAVEKGGVTYAEPCPTHKPNWVHPDDRFTPDDKESTRAGNIARAKKEFDAT